MVGNNMNDVNTVLNERNNTHGDFDTQAMIAQDLKWTMRQGVNYHKLSSAQREAVDMIAHKLSRVVNGNCNFLDHWVDICGYSQLIVKEIEKDGSKN
jgi:hypothetical protein